LNSGDFGVKIYNAKVVVGNRNLENSTAPPKKYYIYININIYYVYYIIYTILLNL